MESAIDCNLIRLCCGLQANGCLSCGDFSQQISTVK